MLLTTKLNCQNPLINNWLARKTWLTIHNLYTRFYFEFCECGNLMSCVLVYRIGFKTFKGVLRYKRLSWRMIKVYTVHLMSKCKRIFGDIFVTSCSNSPRLDAVWRKISIGFDNRWLISPIDPNCKNHPIQQRYVVAERGRFLQWCLWGQTMNEILPQSLSKTFKWLRWVWAWLSEM